MSHDDGEKKGLQYAVQGERALVDFYPILRFFHYEHLPVHLQDTSRPFCVLAVDMARRMPLNAETSTMLRKLLEAKDCAVRAQVTDVDLPPPREAV